MSLTSLTAAADTTPVPATYQADEHLAQHLLSLGFTKTTSSAYYKARGWRSFYHSERWLSVWLQPERITVQAGARWRFEANGPVRAEMLDYLLTAYCPFTNIPSIPCPTPCSLPKTC